MERSLTKEEINKIRQVKIHTLLGVEDTGRRKMINCPIHLERHPSFALYPDGGYKCFGCDIHGHNSIDFLMAMGYSFVETLEELVKYI